VCLGSISASSNSATSDWPFLRMCDLFNGPMFRTPRAASNFPAIHFRWRRLEPNTLDAISLDR